MYKRLKTFNNQFKVTKLNFICNNQSIIFSGPKIPLRTTIGADFFLTRNWYDYHLILVKTISFDNRIWSTSSSWGEIWKFFTAHHNRITPKNLRILYLNLSVRKKSVVPLVEIIYIYIYKCFAQVSYIFNLRGKTKRMYIWKEKFINNFNFWLFFKRNSTKSLSTR